MVLQDFSTCNFSSRCIQRSKDHQLRFKLAESSTALEHAEVYSNRSRDFTRQAQVHKSFTTYQFPKASHAKLK
ncbi:hypothetical protein L484_002174 [Morus notabilis]|uniref:Uncharacterized protein n=1 Tax=Morus notabilis TaxID=981085 RepID=W9QKU9_9ROSA|nr:hypothetical protein L484_002174 [Morus notabilis]